MPNPGLQFAHAGDLTWPSAPSGKWDASGDFSTRKLHKQLHTPPRGPTHRLNTYAKAATCWTFAEPSDGLEPSTPSLPSPFAPALLHECSIGAPGSQMNRGIW